MIRLLVISCAILVSGLNPAQAQEAAPAAAQASASFWQIIIAGGWSGMAIMFVLFMLSLTAVFLVIEQFMLLRRRQLIPAGLADEVRDLLARGQTAEAREACKLRPSLISFVLLRGLTEIPYGWTAVEKSLEDALAEQLARLMRRVEYLSVVGSLAPMAGLLGTVVGMLLSFHRVAATRGAAGAADLAEGIYQALVTTVFGLVIAIPALGAYAILRNRVEQLIAETAYVVQHALMPVKRRRKTPPAPPVLPPVPENG